MGHRIHIIGGGTVFHVRPHLALSAPAYGGTAKTLEQLFSIAGYDATLHLTKMAASESNIETNADVEALLDRLIADPDTRVIILNAALCDFEGNIVTGYTAEDGKDGWGPTPSGKHAARLKTAHGEHLMSLTPADKLIGKIRKERKDIFVVGFKTTAGASSDEQYATALKMLKQNSLNLVLANDVHTRNNMIIAPEETRYSETEDRSEVLQRLVGMVLARMQNTFTRSTVIDGESVAWMDARIPNNLREVVDYCIERGAYKKVNGVTAGHFAVKLDDRTILTSKRKQDFNRLAEIGLVQVEYEGDDKVVAYGAKPSVGGQSQRIVFREHPGLDCIVHFHCPMKSNPQNQIPVAPQWQNECGSHQCGANTSRNLLSVNGREDMKVVMLEDHGPNIVFSRDVSAKDVIAFIEANFDLSQKTGGLVAA